MKASAKQSSLLLRTAKEEWIASSLRKFPRNGVVSSSRRANTSSAARSPQSRAPCAVEKKSGEVASPAKNGRPSTGAASTARSPAWPGRACEYEPRAKGSWAQRDSRAALVCGGSRCRGSRRSRRCFARPARRGRHLPAIAQSGRRKNLRCRAGRTGGDDRCPCRCACGAAQTAVPRQRLRLVQRQHHLVGEPGGRPRAASTFAGKGG